MLRDWEAANFFLLILLSAGKLEETFEGEGKNQKNFSEFNFALGVMTSKPLLVTKHILE